MSATIAQLSRKRATMQGEIAVMRQRHRKRRPLLKLLSILTTMQLRAETRKAKQKAP